MRFIINVLSFILLASASLFAQDNQKQLRFQDVDHHVSTVSKQLIFHPQLLSQKLTEGLTNDYDKVRACYVWIARNIDYDFMAFIHKTKGGQSVNQVMRSGKALCEGFSLLFEYFCEEVNIESKIIEGYAKGYGYRNNQKFKEINHSWNAVKIYDRWYLLDVTWAIGNPTNLSRHQKKVDLNTYFLSDPEVFIKTHLPQDPSWQLIDKKISLNEFELDEYENHNDWSFNSYAPKDYENLNEYDTDILSLKRSKAFHPTNDDIDPLLAFAYLYKGISLTEEIWKMDYFPLLDTITYLGTSFAAYMDSVHQISNEIIYNKVPYTKHIFQEEIMYQTGVFYYELAVELFSKARDKDNSASETDLIINNHFETAQQHFEQTAPTSIYYKDAQEYLSYIEDFRSRKLNWFSSD